MKLMKALMTLLVVASLVVPVVAIAEDRLSLSGSMRVRGYIYDADLESTGSPAVPASVDSSDEARAANYQALLDDVIAADQAVTALAATGGDITDAVDDFNEALADFEDCAIGGNCNVEIPGIAAKDGLDESGAWNDQRLRIAGKLAVAEGVTVHFRLDATESDENSSDAVAWGGTSSAAYQYAQRRADIQFDKAYLQLDKFGGSLLAGQQYFGGVGYTRRMIDVVGAGFIVKYKGFKAQHVKRMDEDAGKNGFFKYDDRDEVSLTAISYDYKGDGFSLTPAIAYNDNQNIDNTDFFGAALAGSVDIGPVLLKGEFDYFDGDTDGDPDGELPLFDWGTQDADLKGTQLYLDASMSATDALRVGVMGLWAAGYDKDDEVQITTMSNDGTIDWTFVEWNPQTYGYQTGDVLGELDIFDPTGAYAGVQAGSIYADFKVSEDLGLMFSGLYWQVDEDKIVDADGYFLNASFKYNLMENTALISQANYTSISWDKIAGSKVSYDDDLMSLITSLVVSF